MNIGPRNEVRASAAAQDEVRAPTVAQEALESRLLRTILKPSLVGNQSSSFLCIIPGPGHLQPKHQPSFKKQPLGLLNILFHFMSTTSSGIHILDILFPSYPPFP